MSISPRSFFNNDTSLILAKQNAERNQADAKLDSSFQLLGSTILRLTNEINSFSSSVISGQRQENKIVNDYIAQVSSVQKPSLGEVISKSMGGSMDGMGGLTAPKSMGETGGMDLKKLLAGGLAAGGISSIISSVLSQSPDDSPDDSPDGSSGNFSGSTGAEKTMSYLISQGLTPEQAAGVAGNLQQESSFDPNRTNKSGHTGIAQWDPENRWPTVSQYIQSTGQDPRSLEGQLTGLKWEAEQRGDWNAIKGAKNEQESAKIFLERFERSGEKPGQAGYENRMKYSSDILKKYQSKSISPKSSQGSTQPVSSSSSTQTSSKSSGVSPSSQSTSESSKSEPTRVISVNPNMDESSIKPMSSKEVASSFVPPSENKSQVISPIASSLSPAPPPVSSTKNTNFATGSPFSGHWYSDIQRSNLGISYIG